MKNDSVARSAFMSSEQQKVEYFEEIYDIHPQDFYKYIDEVLTYYDKSLLEDRYGFKLIKN